MLRTIDWRRSSVTSLSRWASIFQYTTRWWWGSVSRGSVCGSWVLLHFACCNYNGDLLWP